MFPTALPSPLAPPDMRFPRVQRLLAHAGACAVALAAGRGAAAQPWAGLPAGARVRVIVPDSLRAAPFAPRAQPLVGTIARGGADTLYLVPPGGAGTVALPRDAVRGLAVSRGASRARSAVEQAVAGAVLLAGAALTADRDGGRVAARRAAGLGAAGAAIGAVIGAARPYERWRVVTR